MPVTVTVHVAAPAATVWELIADVERWPEWNPACASAAADGDPRAEGTRLRLQLRHPRGRLFWTAPTVVTAVPTERFGFVTRALGFRAPTDIALDADDEGTRVTLTSRSTGPLAFSYRLMFPERAQGQLWSGALTGLARHVRGDGGREQTSRD